MWQDRMRHCLCCAWLFRPPQWVPHLDHVILFSPKSKKKKAPAHSSWMGACPAIIILSLYKERGTCPSFPGKHAISLKMRPRHCSFTLLLLFLFQSAIYMYFCSHYYFHRSFVHRWGKSSLSQFFVLYFSLCSIQYLGDVRSWNSTKSSISSSKIQ